MTTIATLAGLLPLVLGIGAGSELQRPLAVAVIGGLSLSTMISLLVLPALVRLSWGPLAMPPDSGWIEREQGYSDAADGKPAR
jgi:Cu/Ag efflux pump CusA